VPAIGLGVSLSESAEFDFNYACVPDETPLSDIMHKAATVIGETQQVDMTLSEIDIDDEHQQLSGQAWISILNLLNTITPQPPSLSAAFLAERNEDKCQIIVVGSSGHRNKLNHNLMIELRKKHDTKNHNTHSGNEKRKRQNFLLAASNPNLPQSTSNIALQPSEASKLVALILKENISQQSSIARMHRWDIQVKFNLNEVRNTSTHVDLNAQLLVQGGEVSSTNELKYGKYALIIKDRVSISLILLFTRFLHFDFFFYRICTLGRFLHATSMFQANTDGLLALLVELNSRTYRSSYFYISRTFRLLLASTPLLLILESLHMLRLCICTTYFQLLKGLILLKLGRIVYLSPNHYNLYFLLCLNQNS
jgi:hypothetical protein